MWRPEHSTLLYLRDTPDSTRAETVALSTCLQFHMKYEINTSAVEGSLRVRLEQSMERVPGSAKIICDCFFATMLNHILSSIVYPCSVICMRNSFSFFVKLLTGLTITVDSH